MQLLSANAKYNIFLKKCFFAHEKLKMSLKIAQNVAQFSTAQTRDFMFQNMV